MNNEKVSDEVMAVIAAALAAYETQSGTKLVVRSLRRIPQNSLAWNATGKLERLSKRLNA